MARRSDEMVVGEDSFLDTVANLVGILIILVVIIGTQTKSAAELIGMKEREKAEEKLEDPATKLVGLKSGVQKQEQQLKAHDFELQYRERERTQILMQIQLAEEALREEMAKLDDQGRAEVELKREIEKLKEELEGLADTESLVENQKPQSVVLQHLPTPMAQTVFGKEMHLRLANGKVSLIPWDRLIDELKEAAPLAARRGINKSLIEDTIGPIDGYMMRYWLRSSRGMVQTANGSVGMGSTVELDRFELEVMEDAMSDTVEESLQMGSRLRVELAGRSPRDTVITVWVYPDSFEQFRQLKEALFAEGFLTAARPLPADMLIGASPRGSRSTAQ